MKLDINMNFKHIDFITEDNKEGVAIWYDGSNAEYIRKFIPMFDEVNGELHSCRCFFYIVWIKGESDYDHWHSNESTKMLNLRKPK